ncbi:hypothetical protein N1851_029481 [Merluccius polli]|uniref:DUF7789 domain-containing protein n=1 Tax=Merluccius polli TaxID=89951 RepID=A0AA47NRP0_MERPO|nr:hypothetical protein N1851_029481 [Merluccius polli]
MKRWSELSLPVQLYFCLALASLGSLLGLTVASLCGQTAAALEQDFTLTLLQLLGISFCVYYVARGVLQENRQELMAFLLSVVIVALRSVVNYSLMSRQDQQQVLVRFVCILSLGAVNAVCTCLLIRKPDRMAFRVGGALESTQERYFLLNLCFSMVTFDLQAQLSLCILMTSWNAMSLKDRILLGVAVCWSGLTAAVGLVAILKEVRVLVLAFVLLNVPEVAFFLYLMFTIISRWLVDSPPTLAASSLLGALVSVGIKAALLWALHRLSKHFHPDLRGRGSIRIFCTNLYFVQSIRSYFFFYYFYFYYFFFYYFYYFYFYYFFFYFYYFYFFYFLQQAAVVYKRFSWACRLPPATADHREAGPGRRGRMANAAFRLVQSVQMCELQDCLNWGMISLHIMGCGHFDMITLKSVFLMSNM